MNNSCIPFDNKKSHYVTLAEETYYLAL